MLRKGTHLDGLCVLCPSQVRAAQMTGCLASTPSQAGQKSYSPSQLPPLGFLVHHKSTAPGVLCVSSRELISLPSSSGCCLPTSLPLGRERPIAVLLCFSICSILCSVSVPGVTIRLLHKKSYYFVSLVIPWFRLLCHISSFNCPWGIQARSLP